MIRENDKKIILKYAKKYDVSDIYLFGSSLEKGQHAQDIDLGVRGIQPKLFFKFYGELFKTLSKPVDLVDLSKKSLFTSLIEKDGVRIYGKPI